MTLSQKLLFLFISSTLSLGYLFYAHPEKAPTLTFKTISGQTLNSSDLLGKPLLINFWASNCQACLEEIPNLIELHQQYTADKLTIIAVAMSYDPPNQVVNTVNAKQIPYAVALDPDASIAGALGNILFTPTTLLIDSNGNIVSRETGKFELGALAKKIAASQLAP
jgi:peroxiredoxin